MRRARYKDAIEWIAANDNAGNGDSLDEIAAYISVALVADVWGVPDGVVAEAVRAARHRAGNAMRSKAAS